MLSLGRSVSGFLQDQRASAAKRSLESELAKIVNLVEGHKTQGLPAGHVYYQMLEKRAKRAISGYQDKMGQLGCSMPTFHEVAMSVPVLKEIEDLASGQAQSDMIPKIGIGVVMSITIMTITWAGCHNLYLFLTHWANIRWAQ